MRLERIEIHGLKGLDVDEPVAPVQVYIGRNGTGKTARLQAVEFLLTGAIKGEGGRSIDKRASGIMALSTGSEVEVAGTFTDTGVRRRVTGTTEKASAKVEGTPPTYSTLALDFGAFLKLSREKQKDALLDLVVGATWDQARVEKYLRGKRDAELRMGEADALVVFDELIADVVSAWADVEDVRNGLDDQFRKWNREATRTAASVSDLAKARAALPVSRPLADFEEEFETRRADLSRVTEELGAAKAHSANFKRRDAERSSLLTTAITIEAGIRDKLEPDLEAMGDEPVPAPSWDTDLVALVEVSDEAGLAVQAATLAHTEASTLWTHAEKQMDALLKLHDGEECPTCRHVLGSQAFDDTVQAASQEVDTLHEEVVRRTEAVDDATASRIVAAQAEKERRDANTDADGRHESWTHLSEGLENAKKIAQEHRDKISKIYKELEAIPTIDVESLEKQLAGLEEAVRVLELERDKSEEARRFDLTLEKARGDKLDAALQLRAIKAMRIWVGPKGIVGEMVREASRPLAERVNALLGGDDAGRFRFVFLDGNRETFDFGFERRTGFVSYRTLSGGQFARLAAAFLAATTALSVGDAVVSDGGPAFIPPIVQWRGLILDNLQDVTEPERSAFLLDMANLVESDALDQVIIASSEPFDPEIGEDHPDVTITRLEP